MIFMLIYDQMIAGIGDEVVKCYWIKQKGVRHCGRHFFQGSELNCGYKTTSPCTKWSSYDRLGSNLPYLLSSFPGSHVFEEKFDFFELQNLQIQDMTAPFWKMAAWSRDLYFRSKMHKYGARYWEIHSWSDCSQDNKWKEDLRSGKNLSTNKLY